MTTVWEVITISREDYDELVLASMKLNVLESYGVDNWAYYGHAMADFVQMEQEYLNE